ncbi:hypothetical protein C8F04DRAFT_25253 [Mycena alexandri]|uniref:Uncharacterized protein n=1 Tax=Mycena alexandri TaxID=1745969 RepID=A0AAD6TPE1_9AGAR|nr:hypothetical protein C8F04DRAFT_25253 [Mycena alexandri]
MAYSQSGDRWRGSEVSAFLYFITPCISDAFPISADCSHTANSPTLVLTRLRYSRATKAGRNSRLPNRSYSEPNLISRFILIPGGNWYYTDKTPVELPVPNEDPRIGDYAPTLPPPGSTLPYERVYSDRDHSISAAERWRK